MKVELTLDEIRWLSNSIQPRNNKSMFSYAPCHLRLAEKMKNILSAAEAEAGKEFIQP